MKPDPSLTESRVEVLQVAIVVLETDVVVASERCFISCRVVRFIRKGCSLDSIRFITQIIASYIFPRNSALGSAWLVARPAAELTAGKTLAFV